MTQPLVSVVLPTHNRLENLRRAVASVLAQSEAALELIIVDDASTDGTDRYLADLVAHDPRIRVVQNDVSKGGAAARNEGIAICRAPWVAFLDDDDTWAPTKLKRQLEALAASPSAVACTCNYLHQIPSRRGRLVVVPARIALSELLVDNLLGGASLCVCSARVLREVGGFDPRLRSAQDHDLWVRLRQRGEVVACNETLVTYGAHTGPRITTNFDSQYLGARRFYFRHRHLMDAGVRRRRMSRNCFVMSRQATRPLRHRIRYLALSYLHSPSREAWAYVRSSLPRLTRDALAGRLRS